MDNITDPPIIAAYHINKHVQSGTFNIEILKDVTFQVRRGETCAIMGISGSGKSTLLALLAGLDSPTSGEIVILQSPLHTMNEDKRAELRAQNIGFIFQNFYLLSHLTALENVMLPLELMNHPKPHEQALIYLDRVGLKARLHHKPLELSGGEQQRVAIARAFASQPKILFADEPTANLDIHTASHIIELLFHLNEEHKTTIVVCTHDEGIAQRCQHSYLLEHGKLMLQSVK